MSWVLPRPSRSAIFGLRLAWLCLVILAVAWLVSLCVDAEQGRTPAWAALLGVLLVAAWSLATRAWLIAATRVPDLMLVWREANRDLPAAWCDDSGRSVTVRFSWTWGWVCWCSAAGRIRRPIARMPCQC